jgi:hypothetical protein
VPQKPLSFGNVESGSAVSAPQAPFDPTGLVTGATGLFDDLIKFPENAATGIQGYAEDYQYPADDRRELGNTEAVLRRGGEGLVSLPAMALSASPIGWSEKALRFAAEKAGVDLPDWVTPATSGMEAAQRAIGVDEGTMRYSGARQEFWTKAVPDAIINAIPIGGGVRAETNARQAFRQASAEGKPHWDATKDALDAIANTEAKLPEAPKVEAPVVDEFDQARAEAWGGDPFADLIPESTGRPLEGATSDSSVGAGVSEPVRVGEAPTSAGEATGPLTYTTAKGSTYSVHEDGSTTRNKAFRPEHGEAEQGPQPKSEKTFYLSPSDADLLGEFQLPDGIKRQIVLDADGKHAAIKYLTGKDAGKIERRTVVPVKSAPEVGTTPVELWNDGSKVHFGNEITEIGAPAKSAEIPTEQPLSAAAERSKDADIEGFEDLIPEQPLPAKPSAAKPFEFSPVSVETGVNGELIAKPRPLSRTEVFAYAKAANVPVDLMRAYHEGTLTTGKVFDSLSDPNGHFAENVELRKMAGYMKGVATRLGGLDVPIEKFSESNKAHAEDLLDQPNIGPNVSSGYYTAMRDRVALHGDMPSASLMLHESVHAATTRQLFNGEQGKLTGPAAQSYQQFVALFEGIQNHFKATNSKVGPIEIDGKKYRATERVYGLQDPHELLAEMFSNHVFRNELKNIKLDDITSQTAGSLGRMAVAKARSVYSAVVDKIRGILGLPAKAETALDALFASSDKLLGDLTPSDRLIGREKLMKPGPKPEGQPTREQIAARAKAAMVRGADSAKVAQRLQEMMAKHGHDPAEAIIPKWQRTASQVVSWRGGRKFAKEMEGARMESATADYMAERAATKFDRAGMRSMNAEQKAQVRAALHGDPSALTGLSPKIKEAVDFTRKQIAEYQGRLAKMNVQMDGRDLTDMLLNSMESGDYVTRAFRVFEGVPTVWRKALYTLSGAEKQGRPFYRWESEKYRQQDFATFKNFVTKLVDKSKPIEPQIEDLLNQFSDPKGPGTNIEAVKQAARDSSILKSRVNVPEPIKKYWGEYRDARVEGALTLSRLGALTAKQGMLNKIHESGAGKYFFDEGTQPQGFTEQLPVNDDYGPLAGKYTRPDIAEELKTTISIEKSTPDKTVNAILGKAFDAYVAIGSRVKLLKTVGSGATQLVNNYANAFLITKIATQHALMGKMLGIPDIGKAIAVNTKDLFGKLTPDEAKLLISNGIIRDGVQFGELKRVRSKVEQEIDREQMGNRASRAAQHAVDVGSNVVRKIGDVYQFSDNLARTAYFYGELSIQKKLHPEWSRQQQIEYAANKARDETPTWGRASPIVKAVSKAESNFATWSGEVVRSTTNQIKNGLNDLVNGKTPQEKYYGFAQLAGTGAYLSLASVFVPVVINTLFGFGESDTAKDKAVSKVAPDYLGGDSLRLADADPKSGRIVFMDSTRLDASAPFHTLMNRELEAIRKGTGVGGAAWDWMSDTFLTPGPFPQAAAAAITGKNRFDQALAPDERTKALTDAFKPGTVTTVEKYNKLKKRGVDRRILTATSLGLPLYDYDTRRATYFAANDFKKQMQEYRQQFNRRYGAADASPDDQKDKYTEFLRNEKAAFDTLSDHVKALETIFGKSEGRKIATDSLKEAKLDKDYLNALLNGEFIPNDLTDSKSFLDSQERNAVYNDPSREKEIRQDFRNRRQQLGLFRRNWESLLE